jgi:hypothetical protein
MFCPLCKAEYQQGFSTCCDCTIPLVATEDEARHIEVNQLWQGRERHEFDAVIAAIKDAGIPFQAKETLRPRLKFPFFGIPIALRSSFQYEILVFRSDLVKAKQSIQGIFDDRTMDD